MNSPGHILHCPSVGEVCDGSPHEPWGGDQMVGLIFVGNQRIRNHNQQRKNEFSERVGMLRR